MKKTTAIFLAALAGTALAAYVGRKIYNHREKDELRDELKEYLESKGVKLKRAELNQIVADIRAKIGE